MIGGVFERAHEGLSLNLYYSSKKNIKGENTYKIKKGDKTLKALM